MSSDVKRNCERPVPGTVAQPAISSSAAERIRRANADLIVNSPERGRPPRPASMPPAPPHDTRARRQLDCGSPRATSVAPMPSTQAPRAHLLQHPRFKEVLARAMRKHGLEDYFSFAAVKIVTGETDPRTVICCNTCCHPCAKD